MSLKTLSPAYYRRTMEVSKRVPKSNRILNAGCSDGYFDRIIKNKGKRYGIDINETEIKLAKIINNDVKYKVGDLCNLPYPDKYFDTIISIDVIEHIEDDKKAVSELVRVLKKNGTLILTVPQEKYPPSFDPINFMLKFFKTHLKLGMWAYGHKRLYTLKDIKKLFKKHNLKIIEVKYISHFIIGIFDNSILVSLLQFLVKADPRNQQRTKKDIAKIKNRLLYKPPRVLTKIRDFIIRTDKFLFKNSKSSLEILVVAKMQ